MDRLYRIKVPLPNSPLKELNSYVIKGDDRNLIIDTGFNRTVCYNAMKEGLDDLIIERPCLEILLNSEVLDKVQIINGLEKGNLTKALNGKPVGTVIYKS